MSRNIFYNLVSLATMLALGFFISPMILRNLGDVRYGVWALFGELVIYLGRMDFGVRSTVSYFVSRAMSLNNTADIRRYVSSASVALLVVGSASYIVVLILIFVFQRELMRNYTDRTDVLAAAAIFAAIFCFGFPLEVYASALTGSRQRYLVSTSEIISRLISAAVMVAILLTRPSLVGLAAAQAVAQAFTLLQCRYYARKYVPDAVVDFRAANWATVKELFHYGTRASIVDLSFIIGARKDVVVTTAFLGPARVPTLTFARQFTTLMMNFCKSVTHAIRPNLVHHWTLGEKDAFYNIYYAIARYSAFVAMMIASFLVVFGKDFIGLWIGERFVTGDVRFRSDLILLVLLLGYVPRAINSISVQALLATRQHSSYARAILADSLASLGMALFVVRPFGTLGLAFSSTIPALVTQLYVLPRMVEQKVGASIRRYWTDAIGPSMLVAAASGAVGFAFRHMAGGHSWWRIGQGGTLMALVGFALAYFYLLKDEHRKRLIGMVRDRLPRRLAA